MSTQHSPYAHSPNDRGEWHLLEDHLREVARRAKEFGDKFGAGQLAEMAAWWHDLGKVNPEFQAYLDACDRREAHAKVPHAIWASAWAYHLLLDRLGRQDQWQEIALAILGHHAGLGEPGEVAAKLHNWWTTERDARKLVHGFAQGLPVREPESPPPSPYRRELWLRMIFSALVDADRLDTERHFKPNAADIRGEWTRPEDLWRVFRPEQLRMMWAGRRKGHVNEVRRQIYRQCVLAAKQPQGVFRLTVPTGGGKTRSALAFALRHAVEHPKHGFRRVVVALPYTSIIDQTAKAYRDIFGDRLVLEHHSQVELPDAESQDPVSARQRCAAENWDHPLIVTTTVQLFESLFANKPGACRKLHNLARSILILDEVQTLPPELLTPTLDVLRALVDDYGVTLVLSTATQPAYDQTPYLKAFEGLSINEIVPRPQRFFLDEGMKRVEYQPVRHLAKLTELADELCRPEARQCLVVVNTRKHAMLLHAELHRRRAEGLYHLSALLCGAHRKRVLTEIASRLDLDNPRPVRLVSTQVVEAGVDLDFPLVYRALGPLDRIVQAAGRCNREGRRAKGEVIIFDWPDNASPPGSYKIGLEDAKMLLDRNEPDRLHDPLLHTEYFQCLFRDVDLDKKSIQPYRRDLNYPEVASRYKLIEDTVPVVVPTYDSGEGEKRLQAHLRSPSRESWRRLLPYVVNIRQRDAERLGCWLEQVSEGLYRWTGEYDGKTHRGIVADVFDPADLIFDRR